MKTRTIALTLMAALFAAGCAPGTGSDANLRGLDKLDFRQVVASAKEQVFPAVVFIKTLTETHEAGKKITQEMAGSGVIISPDGEVLTNWHVIDKAVEVRCLLYDGSARDAEVVGSDKDTDLALLRLKPSAAPVASSGPTGGPPVKPLPYAVLGDSTKLKEGDFVMAMGAPWGLNRSVSIGIISCTRRFLPDNSQYSLWLQTDASISPGNSGGPLVNTQGEIVGINTRGVMQGGDTGFAIPSATIEVILPQLRESKKVNWSWTGLQLQPLKDFNKKIYFDGSEGVVVSETDPESPARRAGILPRDRIMKLNGEPLDALRDEDLPAVQRRLGLLPKYKPATLQVLRDGKTVDVPITPREKGKVEGEELDCPRWDLTVKTINQFDNEDLYYYRKQGVFIFGVKYPGNAASAGLNRKDIVLKIDGKDVATLDDVRKVHKDSLAGIDKKNKIIFTVLRNGLLRQVVLDFQRDYEKE